MRIGDDITELLGRLKKVSDSEADRLRSEQPEANSQRIQFMAEATLPTLHHEHNGHELNACAPWKRAMDVIRDKIGTGFTIAIIGTRGAGKTQIGTTMLIEGINKGLRGKFTTVTRLLMEVKATYSKTSKETEIEVMDRYTRYKLLVIDEVSRRPDKDWNDLLLFELLNARYNAQRGTLLISNETREGFTLAIGPSMMDRMNETGGIIECNWPSFRQQTKQT